ncbi:MAG: hypothetical protein AMJ68_06810 [Acidithiobacillales bacterium SG8_45]|jgi:uncharacterized membrane protein YfcA|nr:MAG: hypothetical protein AMJ68_06810 [Acidithiobacillales bacterium SG8_45]
MSDLGFLPILLVGAFIHGVLGFGFPMLSTPALILFMELPRVVLLTLVPTVSINIISIAGEQHWREALRRYWPIPAAAIVGSMLGTEVMLNVDPEPLRLLLALVLVVYLIADRLPGAEVERHVPRWQMALLGLGLGLMGGMINIIAPAIVVYALFTRMNPLLMVSVFNISFLVSKSGQILGFIANNALDWNTVKITFWVLPLILLTLWLGMRLRRRMNLKTYQRLLRASLWLIAIVLLVDGGIGLLDGAMFSGSNRTT